MKQQEIDRLVRDIARQTRLRDIKTIEGKVERLGSLVERLCHALTALNARLRY